MLEQGTGLSWLKCCSRALSGRTNLAHPGWCESLFLKLLLPRMLLGTYGEFFYTADGADVGFDREFPVADTLADASRLIMKSVDNSTSIRQ